jgi:hypothetical protein
MRIYARSLVLSAEVPTIARIHRSPLRYRSWVIEERSS